jgi:hypothetical protein
MTVKLFFLLTIEDGFEGPEVFVTALGHLHDAKSHPYAPPSAPASVSVHKRPSWS